MTNLNIDALTANKIAAQYSKKGPVSLIGKGTEAIVYSVGDDEVLKIYHSSQSFERLEILQDFYSRAVTSHLHFSIPQITQCGQFETFVFSFENCLAGETMAEIEDFNHCSDLIDVYLKTAIQLKEIRFVPPYSQRFLFNNASSLEGKDWNQFICNKIISQIDRLKTKLPLEALESLGNVEALIHFFEIPYKGLDKLIHGDFHPGNIILKSKSEVSAIIDFGGYTMFGDPLYEIATACGFFSMYESDQIQTRKRLLSRVLELDVHLDVIKLRAYLLVAALLTCDHYPDDGSIIDSGHFQWALTVLRDDDMWQGIK